MLCIGGEHVAKAITENTLFYGDNLEILRDYLIDECVDLVYLDPPFNSNRNYNVLFKDEQGLDSGFFCISPRNGVLVLTFLDDPEWEENFD
jgi:DNA modification methylase